MGFDKEFDVCGLEHVHLHTADGSLLDGFGVPKEYAIRANKINQKFLTISDHGMMSAVPEQIKVCEKYNLSPIFACELYINPMQFEASSSKEIKAFAKTLDEKEKKRFRSSAHLLAIAVNEIGYRNLVRLSSWGWTKGFYSKPRINHEMLQKYKEGLIFTSCCYSSEVGRAFDEFGEDRAFEVIQKYIDMVGFDNYYLEFMLLDFNKQKPYNKFIIKAHEKFGLPLIVSNDVHFCEQEDSHFQHLMLMIQTKQTIQSIEESIRSGEDSQDLFAMQDPNLWMKSEDEINAKWKQDYQDIIPYELFCDAKRNTVRICERAKGVKLDRTMKFPELPDADDKLLDAIKIGVKKRNLPQTKVYQNRIREEYSLICRKGFSSYFLIQKKMTDEARRICPELLGWGDGTEALGCGRGSAVASLICYCLGITDVDPVYENLLFSRFLSESRGGNKMRLEFEPDDFLDCVV